MPKFTHDEHIIHNALHGRLTSSRILCQTCDATFGHATDSDFVSLLTPPTARLKEMLLPKQHGRNFSRHQLEKQVAYFAGASLSIMYPTASAGPDQPNYVSDPAQLPGLLQQLVADLDNPAITYLLGGHYYERTNHPRTRHFPAVFSLQQGEVANVEVGPDFVAFDTEFVRYPEQGELHYPGPWADRFRATVPFDQLYQLYRKVLTPAEQATDEVSYGRKPSCIIMRRSINGTLRQPTSTKPMRRPHLRGSTR